MATIRKTLGEAIREAREERGLTQRELGQQLDLDPKNIQRYENGKSPELWVLERLFRFFEWPLPYSGTTPPRARTRHIRGYVTSRINLLRCLTRPPFGSPVRGMRPDRVIGGLRVFPILVPMSAT